MYGLESNGDSLYRVYFVEDRALVKKVTIPDFKKGEYGAGWIDADDNLLVANNFTTIIDKDDTFDINYHDKMIPSFYADGATCRVRDFEDIPLHERVYSLDMDVEVLENNALIKFHTSNKVPSNTTITTNFGTVVIKKGLDKAFLNVDTTDYDVYKASTTPISVSSITKDDEYTLKSNIKAKSIVFRDINDITSLTLTNKRVDDTIQEYTFSLSNIAKEDIVINTNLGKKVILKDTKQLTFTQEIEKGILKISSIQDNSFEQLKIHEDVTPLKVIEHNYFIGSSINLGYLVNPEKLTFNNSF